MNKDKLTNITSRGIERSRIKYSDEQNNKLNHKGNNEIENKRRTPNLKNKYKWKDNNLKFQTQDKEKMHRRDPTYGTNRYHIIAQIYPTTSNTYL